MSRKLPMLAVFVGVIVGCRSTKPEAATVSRSNPAPSLASPTVIQAAANAETEGEAVAINRSLTATYFPMPADVETKPLKIWEERMKETPDKGFVIRAGGPYTDYPASARPSEGPPFISTPLITEYSNANGKGNKTANGAAGVSGTPANMPPFQQPYWIGVELEK